MKKNKMPLWPGAPILALEASAGSGKTFALARRYIELVVKRAGPDGEDPVRNTLAITFTNKAALEMKGRIIELLKKISLDAYVSEDEKRSILSALTIRPKDAKAAAGKALDYIIRNYHFFHVRTIDSFINTLLMGSALDVGLSASFTIEDSFVDYLEYSLNKVLDAAGEDSGTAAVIKEFLAQYLFIENKEAWFPHRDMLALLISLFSINNTYGGSMIKSGITAGDIITKKREIVKSIKRLHVLGQEGTDKRFLDALAKINEDSEEGLDIGKLSRYFRRDEYPVKKGFVLSPETAKLWKGIRNNIKKTVWWEALSRFDCYIDMYERAYRAFKELAVKKDVIFLEELNHEANRLFEKGALTIDELYYRLSARFDHVLVDEFQDTSILQWQNFRSIVAEALSTGGTFFYVGDKKQAVYRFRGGDVRLFDAVGESLAGFGLEKKRLESNFRSQRSVVEFNNFIFSRENLGRFLGANYQDEKDGPLSPSHVKDILAIFEGADQAVRPGYDKGFVRVERLDAEDEDEDAGGARSKLIRLIGSLKERFRYQDIAVLARSNDDVAKVTEWLIEEDIPVESERTLDISAHSLVNEIVSFLAFLNSPIDNLAFAGFILGEIFPKETGVSHEDLRDLVFQANSGPRPDQHAAVYLYKEFRKRYPDIWEKHINVFFKKAGTMPLYEFAVTLVGSYRVLEHFPMCQAFVMRFLELIKEQEDKCPGIEAFLEYFKEAPYSDLYVRVRSSAAVRALTIHQAKGLQFGVVIIPFLTVNPKVGSGDSFGYGRAARSRGRPYVVQSSEEGTRLLYLPEKYTIYSDEIAALYSDEYARSLVDELDTVYVALTRAQYELYVFIPGRSGTSKNAALSLVPEDRMEWGKEASYAVKPEEDKEKIMPLPASKPQDWIQFIKNEFFDGTELIRRSRIMQGDVFHLILSCIGCLDDRDLDKVLAGAVLSAKAGFPGIADLSPYEKLVRTLIQDGRFKFMFYAGKDNAFTEKKVVTKDGRLLVMDRVVVSGGIVFVIDYKIAENPEMEDGYRSQVMEYKENLKELYPGKEIKGFLLYLDTLKLDEI